MVQNVLLFAAFGAQFTSRTRAAGRIISRALAVFPIGRQGDGVVTAGATRRAFRSLALFAARRSSLFSSTACTLLVAPTATALVASSAAFFTAATLDASTIPRTALCLSRSALGRLATLDCPGSIAQEALPASRLFGANQGDGVACASGTASAADAVGVIGDRARNAVVHHMGHMVHIKAARGHIGGYQGFDIAFAEGRHDPEARGLVVAAVQGLDRIWQALQAS